MKHKNPSNKGRVYLIGAGPGDPRLITVRGADLLREADVIVYDRLANPELLSLSKESSEHIYVGKRPGRPSVSQEQINRILVARAREGHMVARLKGGDPFVFGRGGEECLELGRNDVPFEVIPGISSALAAPAYAGIPVTHRKKGRSFSVVTGHTVTGSDHYGQWGHISETDTLVILMGMRKLPVITEKLIDLGRKAETPVVVVQYASYDKQQKVKGTLADIADKVSHISPPATIVVGELAGMSEELDWFQPGVNALEPESKRAALANFAG